MRSGVVESAQAVDGYKAVTDRGNTVTPKDIFLGNDREGQPWKMRLDAKAKCGIYGRMGNIRFEITQDILPAN